MISEVDTKQGGNSMSFEEFLAALTAPVGNRTTREGINKMFDLLVEGGGDTISLKHLEAAAKELGEEFSASELKEILKSAAGNGTEITRDEFYTVMIKRAFS